jgi:hypothetical protein
MGRTTTRVNYYLYGGLTASVPGTSTSGATIAARPRLLVPTCALPSGRSRPPIRTLVENVATSYYQLRTLDAELAITKRTQGSQGFAGTHAET